ncbi:hypothetical protein SAMN05421503_0766 [Terribacillus aidingensis]|uniref:O-antigen ligase n=1 Tax=Terribacillus aidingensis TaxID=586416 RepID=A0A285N5P7_9BACI|nr:hypothetical protein [Terribacillus aidingensis]SNZ04795.1 hypothetical protein SAMN05421503_0766 [Terribacillus aidingensis]
MIQNPSLTRSFNDKGLDLFSSILFGLFLSIVMMSAIAFHSTFNIIFYLLSLMVYIYILVYELQMVERREFSFYITIPILISATQNLYLSFVSPYADASQIQLMVITNFLYSAILIGVIYIKTPYRFNKALYQKMLILFIVLVLYSLATIIIFNAHITSALASLRNVMTPMLFILIGLIASSNVILSRYLRYLSYIVIFVVIFGFAERFLIKDIWHIIHLPDLWTKKGLPLNAFTGLPGNFYSSEMVGGQQLRRMVSSFADPVNLGTFLFFGFMVAWYLRNKFLAILLIISIGLAVSKGAILGLLIFSVVWAYHKFSKAIFILVMIGTCAAGGAFVVYSMMNSTMSMLLHITGFFAAFPELVNHPLGRGLGNIGVLAGLYSSGAQTEITESGLGMIIGQLGILGLILYVYFFTFILKQSHTIQVRKDKILLQTLTLGILANITFNEVALSPNSSAVYFITIGIILGQWHAKTKDVGVKKKKNRIRFVW